MAAKIFGEALDLPREQKAWYLDGACRGDVRLRQIVEGLLTENDRLSGFLSDPPYGSLNPGATVAAQVLAPGTQFGGRYRIAGTLGAGGMGVVYGAHDEKLDRDVAIKMLRAGVLTDEEARRRFRREARALAKLNHAGIAAVYDVAEEGGADFILMELVRGESLAAKLRAGPMAVREATAVALQVAEALEEAHERGVIHRDLKPANVMMTPKGQVKVLDFGLAKLLGPAEVTQSLAETQGVMGTPLYMSPEQALGRALDARTDLWSLGAVYYELLTGRAPFRAESGLGVLQSVTKDSPVPARKLRPETPEEAERIVGRALEKDPRKRYATASEMAVDLSRQLAQMSGAIPAAGATRSTQMLRMTTAGLTTILIAGGLVGWWLYQGVAERRWAREEASPKITSLMNARLAVQAFTVLKRAERDLPGDQQLEKLAREDTQVVTVTSEPSGAEVSIEDYLTPQGPPLQLGTTPLERVLVPKGYFRWTVAKAGAGSIVAAPQTGATMHFDLAREHATPAGMVYAAGGT